MVKSAFCFPHVLSFGLEALTFDIVPELFSNLCARELACSEEGSQVGFKFYGFVQSFRFVCHDVIFRFWLF